ncbi:metallophosphoesterase family protein [Segniliparus rugosus]|nr:exonuclease SbcCD subunit D [Segniliparus rugosus]
MVRFVHTADWQLGMTRHFLSEEAQARYSDARLAAIGAIGRLAEREHCEFVLVCGDVFESNQLSAETVSRALEAMRQAKVPFYLLPGNHDPLSAGSIYTNGQFLEERPPNVVVLDRAGAHEVRKGVVVVAAPWTSKRPDRDPVAEALASVEGWRDGDSVILAAHGGMDVFPHSPQAHGIIRLADLRRAMDRVGFVALGDRHSATEVEDRIWYSGSPEPTNFDDVEKDSGQVLVVELAGRQAQVRPCRIGAWRFGTIERQTDGAEDLADLDRTLSDLPDKTTTVLRLALRGTLSLTDRADLDSLLDRQSRKFASLRLWERRTELAVLPADGEFDGFSGFVGEAVEELAGRANTGNEDAQQALGLLLRLSSGARA